MLIHTAEDWSLHVARPRCIFNLTFLKILCEKVEVNQGGEAEACIALWKGLLLSIAALLTSSYLFFVLWFFTFPCQYFSSSTLELISPSQEFQFCLCFYFTFVVLAHVFSHTLKNNFLSKTEPWSRSCAVSN